MSRHEQKHGSRQPIPNMISDMLAAFTVTMFIFLGIVRYIPLSDSVSLVLPTRCLLLRALADRVNFRVITAFFEPSPSLSDMGPDSTADDGAFDCGGVSTRDRTPGGTADFLMAAVFL